MSDKRPCPVCQSEKTGGYPKGSTHTGRGSCKIDSWVCLDCRARWEIWYYTREDVSENKAIHVKDGRVWADGEAQGQPIQCRLCKGTDVLFIKRDGHWRNRFDVDQLRYECDTCGGSWVNMTQEDGTILMWRLWRPRMR